jgi:membrane dipeptidase
MTLAETSRPARLVIDGMQFARWSEEVFLQMRQGGVSVVHVTVAYHESFRDTVDLLVAWNERFHQFAHLIALAGSCEEIDQIVASGRTAILFGLQNPSAVEADIGLVEVLHRLGIRFMQLSYNNQSLLCTGWTEQIDGGLTNMGRHVVREMNRLGMIADMSHSAERSTLDAIEFSERPIVVSHGNPLSYRETGRNKSDVVLKALGESGGLIGLSLYPAHLRHGSATTLDDFCGMVAGLADLIGAEHIGIGSDLCQDQPPSVLAWMREGKWKHPDGHGNALAFPAPPSWFRNNLDFPLVRAGLLGIGFSEVETDGIMGLNWYRFLSSALHPGDPSSARSAPSLANPFSAADHRMT